MSRSTKLFAALAAMVAFGPVESAHAGWNNVFQTTCNSCRTPRASSSFFAPAPAACPTITYQQRTYYQPVTTYKRETYTEAVTTYRTSYYYEPVTSYSYTSYYDPCTGCCQQVATPRTSYRLRSQCNPVQSYVQRCRLVPVTEMRASYYLEPVVTYAAPACPTCPTAGPAPVVTEGGPTPQRMPQINEGISSDGGGTLPKTNIGGPQSRKQITPPAPIKAPRADRTASMDRNGGLIQGTFVFNDRITPRGDARLLLVSAETNGEQIPVQTDGMGRFRQSLTSGDWLIYIPDAQGKPQFHTRLTIQPADDRLLTLVSR